MDNKAKKHPKTIGLALGGGGAKGLAHIGVIKALEVAGVEIDFIAGTSMGALVGGFYAATRDIKFLENQFLNLKKKDIFPARKILRNHDGILFKNQSIIEALESSVKDVKIENCKISFRAIATNVENGDEVLIGKGSLVDAIKASTAIPLAFRPVSIGGKLLMDGAFVNPVPANVVKDMGADYVIAVDVSSRWVNIPQDPIRLRDIPSMINNAFAVVEYQLAKYTLEKADLVIKPAVLSFSWLDFGEADQIIEAGRKELKRNLKEIRGKTGYPELPKTSFEKFLEFLFES